jgi:hypothetical protein
MNASEKWAIVALVALGVFMFFFPILTIQVPIAGVQSYTGYDVVIASRGVGDVTRNLSSSAKTATSPSEPGETESMRFPLSLRLAPLIYLSVAVAFLAALATIAGVIFSMRVATIGSLLGTLAGILAITHVKVLNSDVHRMLQDQIAKLKSDLSDNPFAGVAEGFLQLLAGGINIVPGIGLYILTVCLGFSFVLVKTRILARLTITPSPGPSAEGL